MVWGGYFFNKNTNNKNTPLINSQRTQLLQPAQSTPTVANDITANWKTFTSAKGNYSFKYPPEWPLVQVTPAPQCTVCVDNLIFTPSYNLNSGDTNIVVINVEKSTLTQEQYFNNFKTNSMYVDVKDATLGGEKAISYKLNGGIAPLPIIQYQTLKNNLSYSVRLDDSPETNKNRAKNIELFNQLLSTFKFTDQTTNTPGNYNSSETNGFPAYPGSVFIKKETHEPCPPGGAGGFAICDTVTYTWETNDDYDQVSSWYKEDKSNSGWKCSGGAGSYTSPRDASGRTTCKKGDISYSLDLSSTADKTQVSLITPIK